MRSSSKKQDNTQTPISVLSAVCLDKRNIKVLVSHIRENVKISEKSIPRCAEMIIQEMKKNIAKLSRPPKDKEEMKEFVYFLNKACINNMMEYLIKKFPNLHINKRTNVAKEKIKRDMDVYGDRSCHISNRPHANTTKSWIDDDDNTINMDMNDTGIAPSGNHGNYASPWDNFSITSQSGTSAFNNSHTQNINTFNNPHTQKNPDEFDQRFQLLMSQRSYDIAGQNQKPPERDFSLDGSGDKRRREQMNNSIDQQIMESNSTSVTSGIDDFYSSLLGAGAPTGNNLGTSSSSFASNNTQEYNNNDSQHSARAQQFQSSYEKHMEERRRIDIETGHVQPNQMGQQMNQSSNQLMMSQSSNQFINQQSMEQQSNQFMNQSMQQPMLMMQ